MRFLIVIALALFIFGGCSSPLGIHNSDEYEYGDSKAVIKSEFPGRLIERKRDRLVGETSVDGKSYGVTFCFFEDQLVMIYLCAKSHSNGEFAGENYMAVNRDANWDSNAEYEDIRQKLNAKYGDDEKVANNTKLIYWNLPEDDLSLWVSDGIVGVQYQAKGDNKLGKILAAKNSKISGEKLKDDF